MLITFSTGTPGLTPGYAILSGDGSLYAARTAAGVSDLGGGEYGVSVADAALAGRTVLWDTGEDAPRYASESFPLVLSALAGGGIILRSPVDEAGTVRLNAGDDYADEDGRALTFLVPVASVPDLTGATVKLVCAQATWIASSVVSDGTDWIIKFTPAAVQTRHITAPRQRYAIRATLADADEVTLPSESPILLAEQEIRDQS